MAIQVGSRFGSYEISGSLGVGGMGQVYRAHDHRLGRDVALKVINGGHDDPERLARFEREARALAALNHPNIATIHGLEDAGGEPVLVMELVDGKTLWDRIRKGPIPIDEARTLALQIVDGLDAAHEHGIVHRDLKPANIKVRNDGTLKLLDFGLAKIFAPDGVTPDLANSPTITAPMMTSGGVLLGTTAYMSPEQARGRPVDKRTDIWAFGCVLYEMLTGHPAFRGDTTTDVLAAVLQGEPDWTRLPTDVPASIVSLLSRCLQKDPRERLRDVGDARVELRGSVPAAMRTPPEGRLRRVSAGLLATLAFLTGAGVAGAALYAWLGTRGAATPRGRPTRVAVVLPPGVTLWLGRGSSVAISPDATRIVYVAQASGGSRQLYLRDLSRYESEPIAGTTAAESPFFSPDGRWVGFLADGRLKKVPLDGGAPVTLGEARVPRGHTWLRDDGILVTQANNVALFRIPATGGPAQPFTSLAAGELSHRWPWQLPDASAVLFSIWNDTGFEGSRIVAQRAGSTERTVIIEAGGAYPKVVRDPSSARDYLVYARSEGLLAAPFDARALKLTGSSVPVVDGVLTNLSGGAHFDLAADGTLAYIPGTHTEGMRELVWVSADGVQRESARQLAAGRFFTLDRTGTRVLRINSGGARNLWVDDLERNTSTRLTSTDDAFSGVWTPDGRWAIYPKGAPATNLYRVSTDGRNVEDRLTSSTRPQLPWDVSADNGWLAYQEVDPVSGADVWVRRLPPAGTPATDTEARRFVQSDAIDTQAKFSPDLRWLAYQSNTSGRFEVYVRSFPDGERTVQVSTEGGINPVWSPAGDHLYFRGLNGRLMAVQIGTAPGQSVSQPRTLFDVSGFENALGVAPDGSRFLMMPLIPAEAAATAIDVVLNFAEELRGRIR